MANNWKSENMKANELSKQIKQRIIKVPHYQRGQVWKYTQKEMLIDSIKKGYPFGSILLYNKDDGTYQVIDGLQRISTIYEYLNSPIKFFKKTDISIETLDKIYRLLGINGNEKVIKEKIFNHIKDCFMDNYKTMQDVKNIDGIICAEYIAEQFPTCLPETTLKIAKLLSDNFKSFKEDCEDLANIEIPAIIYEGDSNNLPEIFNRINSKGTVLSKYQILSATWTTHEYTLLANELDPIIEYVDKFYVSIIDNHFGIDGYERLEILDTKKLNLYQIIFGFGKLLSFKFPYLFKNAKNNKEVESCGFNLINCCLGNKNSKIVNMPKILEEVFNKDEIQINKFLVNIINVTADVYKVLKPYLEFKLNKRDSRIEVYHSEFQICSLIANYFNSRYSTFTFDKKDNTIIGRNIKTDNSNIGFDKFKKEFKKNAFKKYLIDIINDNWRGSGDKRMDEVSLNHNYYIDDINEKRVDEELEHWFRQMNTNRHECNKVPNPKVAEKLMLSVIYSHSFSAYAQNDELNYDIEHLAPKGRLKILLKELPNNEGHANGLPISSFGNLCLLREEVNRKKKDKTLYQDSLYIGYLKSKNILLSDVEDKFSFTTQTDLDWLDKKYNDFQSLKKEYIDFLENRFKKQKEIIIRNLFSNNYNQLITESNNPYELKNEITSSQISLFINEANNYMEKDYNKLSLHNDVQTKLKGWKKEVFEIIDDFKNDYFSLEDIYEYNGQLKEKYPNNRNIEAKIRQTLQYLRNDGFIEFLENGEYRRLWNDKNIL